MARVVTKVGDIFEVPLGNGAKRYLQYIVSDLTQLNSDVIRVFKKNYGSNDSPNLEDVVTDEIEFYTHTTTSAGVKLGLWTKVGKSKNIGDVNLLFRCARDDTRMPNDPITKISEQWYVWRVNDNTSTYVGRLKGDHRKAEIGLVFPPFAVVERIEVGHYVGYYPDYE